MRLDLRGRASHALELESTDLTFPFLRREELLSAVLMSTRSSWAHSRTCDEQTQSFHRAVEKRGPIWRLYACDSGRGHTYGCFSLVHSPWLPTP